MFSFALKKLEINILVRFLHRLEHFSHAKYSKINLFPGEDTRDKAEIYEPISES